MLHWTWRVGRCRPPSSPHAKNVTPPTRSDPARLVPAPGDRPESLSRHLGRELGADAVAVEPRAASARDAGDLPARDRAGTARPRPTAGVDVGRVAPRGSGRDEVRGVAPWDVQRGLVRDRDRNTLDGRLGRALRAGGRGSPAASLFLLSPNSSNKVN